MDGNSTWPYEDSSGAYCISVPVAKCNHVEADDNSWGISMLEKEKWMRAI